MDYKYGVRPWTVANKVGKRLRLAECTRSIDFFFSTITRSAKMPEISFKKAKGKGKCQAFHGEIWNRQSPRKKNPHKHYRLRLRTQ